MDLFYGHGMIASKHYHAINKACNFTCGPEIKACSGPLSAECNSLISTVSNALGEYNIYNIYDTCGTGNMTTSSASSSAAAAAGDVGRPGWGTLLQHLERHQNTNTNVIEVGGGPPFAYPCGTGAAVNAWMNSPTVRTAINMPQKGFYGGRGWPIGGMRYNTYTHASIDLWPSLIEKFRVVIYNGDVDACVPYNGNEDWTSGLGLTVAEDWRPWSAGTVPAGYVTTYETSGPANFTFVTVKEAGHLVPGYQPVRAWAMLEKILSGKPF